MNIATTTEIGIASLELVTDLVSLKVDVIFSTQAIVIREAKRVTKTIPVVMAITPDPVASGLVE